MSTGRAVYGTFLAMAHDHLGRGTREHVPGGEDLTEAGESLRRLLVALARDADDLVVPANKPNQGSREPSAWDEVPLQARRALAHASAALSYPRVRTNRGAPGPAGSLARRLDAVTTSLTAGRDLLQTHVGTDVVGARELRTEWAPVIASPPVVRARLAEMAALAGRVADSCGRVSAAAGWRGSPEARRRLAMACDWLWVLEAAVRAASEQEPVRAAQRELLRAIPAAALPRRPELGAQQSVQDLCVALAVSAQRARRAAWTSVQQAAWNPAMNITSLRQTAEAGVIASNNCQILLAGLGGRGDLSLPGQVRDKLGQAAVAAGEARANWLQVAHELNHLTTDTRDSLSWSTREGRELALWTGRLAFADLEWTPSAASAEGRPDPRVSVSRPADVSWVVGAVHESGYALGFLAGADFERVRVGASVGRVLVPASPAPEVSSAPHRYVPAARERLEPLLQHYGGAGRASGDFAVVVGELAEVVKAPTRTLNTAAEMWTARNGAAFATPEAIGSEPSVVDARRKLAGPLERALRELKITNPELLGRALILDRAGDELLIDAADQRGSRRAPTRSLADFQAYLGAALTNDRALGAGGARADTEVLSFSHAAPDREP